MKFPDQIEAETVVDLCTPKTPFRSAQPKSWRNEMRMSKVPYERRSGSRAPACLR